MKNLLITLFFMLSLVPLKSDACDLMKASERAENVVKLFKYRTQSLEKALAAENCSKQALRSQNTAGEDCAKPIVREIIANAQTLNIEKMNDIETREKEYGCEVENLRAEIERIKKES